MPENLDIVRQLGERWNAGDLDGMLELYHDDVVVKPGEHWLDDADPHHVHAQGWEDRSC